MTSEENATQDDSLTEAEIEGAPNSEQFILLAQKVEELEDRVRSLVINDIDPIRGTVDANRTSIQKLKSPKYWLTSGWRRIRRAVGGK